MGIRFAKISVGLAIGMLAVTAFTGCASNDSCATGRTGSDCGAPATTAASTTPTNNGGTTNSTGTGITTGAPGAGGTSVIAPIIIDPTEISGQVVTVGLNNVIVISAGTTPVTSFTATVGEPTIGKFVPGKVDGSATFNPGIQPLAAGASTVTITNTDTGVSSLFDMIVTP
ncbi:hypothetical protein [Subtercola lobariae]|uniref:Uncharacterized protein n=2 Tax=Subtercola lobariae TaxID=1588641 RepID=A0A917B2Z3_9MICO|nr:hypothetical protein [Subtercola lobariae]GGF14818.1 hypothetical protein GCM10011399_05870 [Subtercola lobariae]